MSAASSVVRRYKEYFTPQEIDELVKANSRGSSLHTMDILRQQACNFAQDVGEKLGFPRRTIATSQVLYHRFHLYFPVKDFGYQDVIVSALLVASKLEDTLKKLREIQIAAQAVKSLWDGVGATEADEAVLEYDRARLIGIERLILESVSFNFNLQAADSSMAETSAHGISGNGRIGSDVFVYIIKLGKRLQASKEFCQLAFRLGIDAHTTLAPLSYPPQCIALACLWLASFLQNPADPEQAEGVPTFQEGWTTEFSCLQADVESIAYAVLNVVAQASAKSSKSLSTSPADRSPAEGGRITMSAATEITQAAFVRLHNAKDKRKAQEGPNGSTAKRAKVDLKPDTNHHQRSKETSLGRDDSTIRFQF